MSSLVDHYRILGVTFGAAFADVTSSYRRLCRIYHPDVSADPESEELMKRINIAYTVLREKFRRESAIRERYSHSRHSKRSTGESRAHTATKQQNANMRKTAASAEKDAMQTLDAYFSALSAFNYTGAYIQLSSQDKRRISLASFVSWRKSVARLHPIQEFKIIGGFPVTMVNLSGGKTVYARRFQVIITEENATDGTAEVQDRVEKLVVYDGGAWKVFLGYNSVGELTRTFDEQFERNSKRTVARHWEDYLTGIDPEYEMLNTKGLKKAASREIYRQRRYGGAVTLAAISVVARGSKGEGQEALQRSAAKTLGKVLRQTDAAAYIGDGVFAILLVELKRKNADDIVRRIIGRIRDGAGKNLGTGAEIKYELDSWHGSKTATMSSLNAVLGKFRKVI